MKTPRLPPITITLSAQAMSIALTTLVSTITIQLGLRPRNAAERVSYKSAPCSLYPFCANEHQHSVWCDVGDFRDELMAGIDPPPGPAAVAAIAEKRAELVALNTRPRSDGEELVASKKTFEVLKGEFRREEAARGVIRQKAQELICRRIEALLAEDVASGKLVISSKNEYDYVKIDDLVRWADYRNVVVEQEMSAPMIRRTTAGSEGDSHSEVLTSSSPPWLINDPRDLEPEGFQPWYTPARYFARQEVLSDSTLLAKRDILAGKVAKSLAVAGFFKRGKAKKPLDPATVKKAFVNLIFG